MTVTSLASLEDDPFAPAPPDEAAELDALARALQLARGFTLLFACCNQASHRDRLMAAVQAKLPALRVQLLPVREPVRSLLNELRDRLDSPPPAAVFVFGLESWLTSGSEAEQSPFILNLNAARNYFPRDVPCPLVLWLPQHLLATIVRGAPDFCSVRSGLHSFCATPQARERIAEELTAPGPAALAGLGLGEKHERIAALTAMLHEYESLPPEFRDPRAESRLLNSLGKLHLILGDYRLAESAFRRALASDESVLGPGHPGTATGLNDLAAVLQAQGELAEAEPLFRRALEIYQQVLGPVHPHTATSLNNLANLLRDQGKPAEAEPLYRRALEIRERALGPGHPDTATSLNNLANLLRDQGKLAEAEPLLRRALEIDEKAYGPEHPEVATDLNSLANLFRDQGKPAEAEPLLRRALEIRERALGPGHPATMRSRENLADLLELAGRASEAASIR